MHMRLDLPRTAAQMDDQAWPVGLGEVRYDRDRGRAYVCARGGK
jgi:hypothetical protein